MDASAIIYQVWSSYSSGWGLCVFAGLHVWLALCLMLIARKNGVAGAWTAWLPIANFRLMCIVGKAPTWCFWAFLTPVAALAVGVFVWLPMWIMAWLGIWAVVWAIAWSRIAASMGKPAAYGLLIVVPVLNLVLLGNLAFGE